MDNVMYKHKLKLRNLLWITWKYSKSREEKYKTAIRLVKLKKLSKGMVKIKAAVEYRKK